MAEALIGAARIRARAVLAKMRSKRGPLIRTFSQNSGRTSFRCARPHVQIRLRNLAIEPERIELAVKGGAPDAQPPRDLGHLTVVMRDSESDGLGFDVLERP